MADMMTDVLVTEIVIFEDGTRGVLVSSPLPAAPNGMVEILLDNGQRLLVAFEELVPQEEGSYLVSAHPAGLRSSQDTAAEDKMAEDKIAEDKIADLQIIPLAEETVTVGKREIETGRVRFRTEVTERTETVDQPLLRTEVSTRRVEVNQFVDTPPAVRYEGSTMIVPIWEEVLVVEKRLRVKEEVHITQVQTEHHEPQTVTLRSETLVEERLPAENSVSV